jgi:hypothetical protein
MILAPVPTYDRVCGWIKRTIEEAVRKSASERTWSTFSRGPVFQHPL